jgi:phosphatidylserine/phosphatidylglycerophosphate/cardiolipin synthase-like enzyme
VSVDSTLDAPIELVTSPWMATFYELVGTAEKELLVASPYISNEPLKRIVEIIEDRQSPDGVHVDIVTNLAIDSLLSGTVDVAALLYLAQSIPNSTVTYLPSLHAKIYVADTRVAVITSANLTNKGLAGNHEYGVLLHDPMLVSKVRTDLTKYASLGTLVSLETLTALSQASQKLQVVRQKADSSIKARLRTAFEQQTEEARLELLKARAKGKTTHGMFCDTVLYLLEQKGPLTTVELHPLVQQVHPDLCDDTIDRVIDGVHFGKRWKHFVRMAQQALKRKGLVGFDGQRWFRIS